VRCEIEQAGANGIAAPASAVSWSSQLDVPGGAGQVVLNGLVAFFQGQGRAAASAATRPGTGRIEGHLVTAAGRPGTWRFDMGGAVEPGSLRVVAGDVVSIGASAVVFRMSGRAGERIVFAFRTR